MKIRFVRSLSLSLVLLAAAAASAAAQQTVVAGRVIEAGSLRPLSGAQVSVEGGSRRAVTDADGRYRLLFPAGAGVRGRELRLRASLIGFASEARAVRLDRDTVTADFALQPSAVALEGLVVTGTAGTTETKVIGNAVATLAVDAGSVSHPPPLSVVPPVPGSAAGAAGTGGAWRTAPGFNTEEYGQIRENPFLSVATAPLSTFSIDVDAASYSNVRRFIRDRAVPPRDAVRIEEMVNYFAYDYDDPRGEHPFSVAAEVSEAPWNPAHRLVHVGLQGRRVPTEDLPPANLVFLVDVSGSMQPANKLPLVKQSLRLLVDQLREEDRVAMVVYAGAAGLVLPSTPGHRKDEIMDAIENLQAGGSTAGAAGIRLAYQVARESFRPGANNRVVLATDGDFNVGISSEGELVRLIEGEREGGIFLTVLGFGYGNLKDAKMEQLADRGNGNYAYIDDLLEARKVLVEEMGGTLLTIAKDVKLQVEFNPARVAAYRLIGYENRLLAAEDFNDDRKDAGELGAGHSVTALYEIVPAGVASPALRGIDSLRYQRPAAPRAGRRSGELLNVKLRYKAPDGDTSRLLSIAVRDRGTRLGRASADFRFAAAVAEFGLLLRESEHRGRSSVDGVLALARGALADDRGGYRREFVRLVESYRELREQQAAK